jgi:hypothetical protein
MSLNRAPFNALVDDDGSNTVGSLWNKAAIQSVILDPVDAFVSNGGLWTPYATVWAGGDGIGPTPGNAIVSGRYFRVGKWVDVAIVVSMGSTTSYGTSSYWVFSLPFQPAIVVGAQEVSLRGFAVSSNGGVRQGLTGSYITTAGLQAAYLLTGAGALVNPTTPFTWSANAVLSIRGSYETI